MIYSNGSKQSEYKVKPQFASLLTPGLNMNLLENHLEQISLSASAIAELPYALFTTIRAIPR